MPSKLRSLKPTTTAPTPPSPTRPRKGEGRRPDRARLRRRIGGYILAEALVSAALASLAGGLAVTLLVWSAQAIDRAQSSVGAMRVMERLYEESRLASPDDLGRPSSGVYGRFQWIRSPGRPLADDTAYAPVPVRFFVRWTSGGRVEAREIQVVVRPRPTATP